MDSPKGPWKRKKMFAGSDRSTSQAREAKMCGSSRIVGSAEAAVSLSPEGIRARRKVTFVAHKPLGVSFFFPMRIYRDIRLGYLEGAIAIIPSL